MNLTGADWQALRSPFLALAAALLAGAAVVLFTWQELALEKLRYTREEEVLRMARERLQKSGEERRRILRYRAPFIALQQRGFIGEEQRINWVDALRAASLQLKMTGVTFRIEAQQPYVAPLDMDTGPYRVRQSPMSISLGLLHEEDLMRFVNALAEQQSGIFALRECSLQRQVSGTTGQAKIQANLQADCRLDWLTLVDSPGVKKP